MAIIKKTETFGVGDISMPVLPKEKLRELRQKSEENFSSLLDRCRISSRFDVPGITALMLMAYALRDYHVDFSWKPNLWGVIKHLSLKDETKHLMMSYFAGRGETEEHCRCLSRLMTYMAPCDILSALMCNSALNEKRAPTECIPTPDAYTDIALHLLDIKKGESVLECCSGYGNFLISAYLNTDGAEFAGIEISDNAASVCDMRSCALGGVIDTMTGSVFNRSADKKADKVFIDLSLGRNDSSIELVPQDEKIAEIYASMPRTKASEWAFIINALERQHEGGRTAVLVHSGLLFGNSQGQLRMRKYLVDNGLLEAVVALPQGISSYSPMARDIMVLSQNNQTVRMMDARDCYERTRSSNLMTRDNIAEAIRRIDSNTEYGSMASHEDLKETKYDLNPQMYSDKVIKIKKAGEPISRHASYIRQGTFIRAENLNRLVSKEETPYQYIILKDIEDDTIKMPLPYLKGPDSRLLGALINEGDLLISRSAPFKFAVVPPLGGKSVVMSGNMYAIHFDKKIHPIYAMCYLKSKEGQLQFSSAGTGSYVRMFTLKALRAIRIHVIPMEEQMKIVEKYNDLHGRLMTLKQEEKNINEQLAKIMDGEERQNKDD